MILRNKIWINEGYLTLEEVKQIHDVANTMPWDAGRTGGGAGDSDPDAPPEMEHGLNLDIRDSQVKWLAGDKVLPPKLNQKIMDGMYQASEESDWYFDISYFESFQYTLYQGTKQQRGFYTWHTDHGGETYDDGMYRKLSMTIQLSNPDDYNGGHFQYIDHENEFNQMGKKPVCEDNMIRTVPFSGKTIGTMIVFPSFLYHQVCPVISGTRTSLVGWACGKPFA